jgi:hypothetical protein
MSATVESRLFSLADELVELRRRRDDLKAEMDELGRRLEEKESALAQAMTDQDLRNFVRSERQFYLRTDLHVSAAAGQGPALIAFLKSSGAGDLVQETVHPSTLRAWARERMEQEGGLPEEAASLLNVFEKLSVGVRKASTKE